MSSADQAVQVYHLRIWIRRVSPQIWRRLLVRNDSTIAELHDTLQIAFGWTDEHLHQFLFIKRVVKPGMGFFSLETAERTLQGYEVMHMIRKGQVRGVDKGTSNG